MLAEAALLVLGALIVYMLYTYKRNHRFFQSRGVKFVPGVPFFGNTLANVCLRKHLTEVIDDVYYAFPEERYVGYIEGPIPILLIRDPEIIKQVTVKDFSHFTDHRDFKMGDLFSETMLMLKGETWHDMRSTMSPAFTSGKMRLMLPFMTEISRNIVAFIEKEYPGKDVFIDDLVRRYTNDVIASTGFGLQVNSLEDKSNEFYEAGQSLMNFTFIQRMKMMFSVMLPNGGQNFEIFPKKTTDFFKNIVRKTMDHREKNKIERPDMIQLLMEASKGTLKSMVSTIDKDVGFATTEENTLNKSKTREWTQDQLAAQAFIFFFAAFESSASAVVMTIHELALNPEVQDKLYAEVKRHHLEKRELAYEDIQELKYLDCVLNETLRKWSPALFLDRVCQKPYVLPPPRAGGKPYTVQRGELVYNCVNSLHMDPQYYLNPEKYDPERFSEENRGNIKPFTFMPFGSGPRNCIGSRYALMEVKILLYHLLLSFEIVRCSRTSAPIRLRPHDFSIKARGGTWVKFRHRVQ